MTVAHDPRSGSALTPNSVEPETPRPDETVARLLRVYSAGSTSPSLAETQSGELYLLKLSGSGPGVESLLTEFLATGLAGRLGLNVPAARPLYLPPDFPWQIGTDEFDDLVQRSRGWNLGLRFVPDARDLTGADLDAVPAPFRADLAVADTLLQNVDRTRANPNLLSDPSGVIWAIDHGACLFLRRIIADTRPFRFSMPSNHFLREGPPPPRGRGDLRLLDSRFLRTLVAGLPRSWLDSLPMGRDDLERGIALYVDAFRIDLNRDS